MFHKLFNLAHDLKTLTLSNKLDILTSMLQCGKCVTLLNIFHFKYAF